MIPYILHVALLITVCICFYKILLRKETFYKLNRYVLIAILALSFIVPLIPVPQQLAFGRQQPVVSAIPVKPVHTIPANEPVSVTPGQQANLQDNSTPTLQPVRSKTAIWPTILQWGFYLYWIGVIVFAMNFLLQFIILLYRTRSTHVKDGRFNIVELDGDKAPCSFGNYIFINPAKYDWDTYTQILMHEKVHIEQGHTWDILLAELVIVFQWFNPFAWLYRKELENNLEFLTDNAVLENYGLEKESYQVSLLKVSVPHLSLGLTTNYNQSILQKRIVMMNAKKSNFNTMWKYFFLLPLIGCLMCALNETVAKGQTTNTNANIHINPSHGTETDRSSGSWFATIKGDKVRIQFSSDKENEDWNSSSDFQLSEFTALPKNGAGEFTLTREAGTMNFKGKFDGDKGYGDYTFSADKSFWDFLEKQGIKGEDEDDAFAFFMMNIQKDYVSMLQQNGFKDISKDDLISMAALKIDAPFIQMWKKNGFTGLSVDDLVSAKAMNIDAAYVSEIKKAGYNNISLEQLISFKAQHITGEYINGLSKTKNTDGKITIPDAEDITAFKAMDIDKDFVKSFEAIGYKDLSPDNLTAMKATGVTADFIKSIEALGYKDIDVDELVSLKSLNVTPEFVKSYQAMGFTNISLDDIVSVKATGLSADYIKSFRDLGYKENDLENYIPLKSLNITPEFIDGFKKLGFTDISLDDLPALKSTGVTPDFIKEMQDKGIKLSSLDKYIQLKTAMN